MSTNEQKSSTLQADVLFAMANITIEEGYQWVPAHRFTAVYHPTVEVELPLLVTGFTNAIAWDRLHVTLANAYPANHAVTILTWTNGQAPDCRPMVLRDLAMVDYQQIMGEDRSMALCVPSLPEGSSFSALQAIVAHLRSPEGCPWDREQTLMSMRHDLLGECVEVMEAIDHEIDGQDNGEHIAEELGDLFMAGVLTLQIAIDNGRFQLTDAMQSIVTKLIRRHPHVFSDTQVDGVDAVWTNWDAIKTEEKLAKGQTIDHPLDGIPAALPALEKAREYQSKAQKAGLLDRTTVAATIQEQLATIGATINGGTITETEFGEFLWILVAAAQRAGINAEDALRSYCVTFRANTVSL